MNVILDLMDGSTVNIRVLNISSTDHLINMIENGKMLVYRPSPKYQSDKGITVSGYAYLNSRHILRIHPAEETF